MTDATRDAVLDQLTDIRCAIRDGQRAYAEECIATAERLLRADDGSRSELGQHSIIARILR